MEKELGIRPLTDAELQGAAALAATEPYFTDVEPVAPPAPPAEHTPVPVHPAVEEIKQQMAGLTAEEIMAGMLPELSRLYRINGELNEAIAELRETQAAYRP